MKKNNDSIRNKIAYSVKESAEATTLSVPHIRNEIKRGAIKAKRVGRRVLITKAELENYINRQPNFI